MSQNQFDPQKLKALQAAISQVRKNIGDEKVHLGTDIVKKVEVISTGCLPLDIALGVGGVPRGRIVEIFGPEASGKTTFAYGVIAEAQKKGELAAFVDVEQAVDPNYAAALGVDFDHMPLIQPDNAEEALEAVELLVRSGSVSVVVLDSVAALVPKAEVEGEMGDMQVGAQARLMGKAMRKLTPIVARSGTIVIFINQLRKKVGGMGGYGPTEITSGGEALKYYASVRLDIRRIKTEKDAKTGEAIANRVRVKVVKNKVAQPYKQAEMEIRYGTGFDAPGALIELGMSFPEDNPVKKTGNFYSFLDNETRFNGKKQAREYLLENPDVMVDIDRIIRDRTLDLVEVDPSAPTDPVDGE